jgi:hypothetical protein
MHPFGSNGLDLIQLFTRSPQIFATNPSRSDGLDSLQDFTQSPQISAMHPSGSDGSDSLCDFKFWESQFSIETQIILSEVSDLSPHIPLDLMVYIHFRTSCFESFNSQLKLSSDFPEASDLLTRISRQSTVRIYFGDFTSSSSTKF